MGSQRECDISLSQECGGAVAAAVSIIRFCFKATSKSLNQLGRGLWIFSQKDFLIPRPKIIERHSVEFDEVMGYFMLCLSVFCIAVLFFWTEK